MRSAMSASTSSTLISSDLSSKPWTLRLFLHPISAENRRQVISILSIKILARAIFDTKVDQELKVGNEGIDSKVKSALW